MKNQQDKKETELIEYPLNVKSVFVTETEMQRLDYMRHHGGAVRDVLRERLVQGSSCCLDGKTHDEVIISLVLAGVSVEQLTSEVRHEVDPLGLRVLERLKEHLGLVALSHGQEAYDQSVAHIEDYLSALKSEDT